MASWGIISRVATLDFPEEHSLTVGLVWGNPLTGPAGLGT